MTQIFHLRNQEVTLAQLQLHSSLLQTSQHTVQVLQVLLVISASHEHVAKAHDDMAKTLQQVFHFTLKNQWCRCHIKRKALIPVRSLVTSFKDSSSISICRYASVKSNLLNFPLPLSLANWSSTKGRYFSGTVNIHSDFEVPTDANPTISL